MTDLSDNVRCIWKDLRNLGKNIFKNSEYSLFKRCDNCNGYDGRIKCYSDYHGTNDYKKVKTQDDSNL